MRVGAFGHSYDHVFSTFPMVTGLPVFTGGFVPVHTYRFFFDGHRDMDMLKAVGVRYVMATAGWDRGRPGVVARKQFGPVHVYEIEGRRAADRITAMGSCSVTLLRASDDGVQAVIHGVKEHCRLRIHRSDFPNWRAVLLRRGDEVDLPIGRVDTSPGSGYAAFMSVDVPEDGVLSIRWEPTRGDRAGMAISFAAAIVWFLLVGLSMRRATWETLVARLSLSPRGRQIGARVVWGALGVGLVGAVVVLMIRSSETRYTFDRHVDDAWVAIEQDGRLRTCRQAGKKGGVQCGADWDLVRPGLHSFIYDSRYCIFAHPSPRGDKHIIFEDVPLSGRLSGFMGLLDSSRGTGPVHMDVGVGDAVPIRFTATRVGQPVGIELTTPTGVSDVTIVVHAPKPAWRYLCFNLQAIPIN